jgi:AraC family transcriptional regulator
MNRAPFAPSAPLESRGLEAATGSTLAPPSASASRCAGIRPEVLARVLQLIDQRYNEPLRVEDLGRHAALSPFHFARMFKISVGQAPHAYLTTKRMQHARELLSTTAVPIAEIARRVGFRTQAHFSGVFRKQVGMTPGQYRREHRREPAAAES